MEEYNEFRNKIDTLIRDAAKTVMPGTVSAVDEKTRTCTVKIGNVDYEDVRLYGIVNETPKGFCFIPKIGSHVLAARIESSNELFIALFTEIDKMLLTIGEKVKAAADKKAKTTTDEKEETTTDEKEEKPSEKTNTVTLSIADGKIEIAADEIAFNGGTLGGLVKIEKLTAKLNALIDTFNDHTHQIPISGVKVEGTPSNQANTTPISVPAIQSKHANVKISDYENTKIKH